MLENLVRLVSPRRLPLDVLCLTVVLWSINALAQTTYTVGPPSAGACGGSNCDYQSIQSAIDAAAAGDTVTAYRRTDDATNNECYNEHITINKANLTVQGASTTPSSAACIGPSTPGDMVTITASGVTLKNLEISGKANDGAAGLSLMNLGGRHLGAGVRIIGNDVDDVIIENCTIAFTRDEQVRWQGDQNGDNNGNVTIRKCYLHHSDIPRANIRIDGGSNSGETHIVEDNYLTTGQGIFSDAEYITVQKNIVEGWPYWGHLVSDGTWPETHDYAGGQATYGGGWRYFSRCAVGIYVQNGGAGTDVNMTLCFQPIQALIVAKVGAAYCSPFLGRLDDIDQDGMELIHDIREIYDNYEFTTEILAASLRHPQHVLEAALAGADIGTMPYPVFQKLWKHPMTDIGLERFLADWKKTQK